MSTITSVSLSIKGDALTSHGRHLVESGRWIDAIQYLKDSLEGMTHEYAVAILSGTHKLTGEDPQIGFDKEDPEITEALRHQYVQELGLGGLLKVKNTLYRPYKIIDNLGSQDFNIEKAGNCFGGDYQSQWRYMTHSVDFKTRESYNNGHEDKLYPSELITDRALHYASDPANDMAHIVNGKDGNKVILLCERHDKNDIPLWLHQPCKDAQESMDAVGQTLPISGCSQTYNNLPFDDTLDKPTTRVEKFNAVMARMASMPLVETPTISNVDTSLDSSEFMFNLSLSDISKNNDRILSEKEITFQAECQVLKDKLIAFADADKEFGWYDFEWKDPYSIGPTMKLRAPKRALYCYALSKTSAFNQAPAYVPLSPYDFKTSQDNVFHTDVWLGCGLPINEQTYHQRNSREYRAVLDMMFDVQKKLLNYDVQVLARGPDILGPIVFHDAEYIDEKCILVLPHAGIEFQVQAMKAGAIICEQGGQLAHLVTVCRELSKPMIRLDNATTLFRKGNGVLIKADTGKLEISSTFFDDPRPDPDQYKAGSGRKALRPQ